MNRTAIWENLIRGCDYGMIRLMPGSGTLGDDRMGKVKKLLRRRFRSHFFGKAP
jgi:hypothetical protein